MFYLSVLVFVLRAGLGLALGHGAAGLDYKAVICILVIIISHCRKLLEF